MEKTTKKKENRKRKATKKIHVKATKENSCEHLPNYKNSYGLLEKVFLLFQV